LEQKQKWPRPQKQKQPQEELNHEAQRGLQDADDPEFEPGPELRGR
jgi:hypothetical protein